MIKNEIARFTRDSEQRSPSYLCNLSLSLSRVLTTFYGPEATLWRGDMEVWQLPDSIKLSRPSVSLQAKKKYLTLHTYHVIFIYWN